MSRIVVDASAVAAIIFGEPESAAAQEMIGDRAIVAPHLLCYEIANVALVKMRRHADRRAAIAAAFDGFLTEAIAYEEIDIAATAAVGFRRELTFYDACYVWLALARGLPLATFDRKMAAAFEAEAALRALRPR